MMDGNKHDPDGNCYDCDFWIPGDRIQDVTSGCKFRMGQDHGWDGRDKKIPRKDIKVNSWHCMYKKKKGKVEA